MKACPARAPGPPPDLQRELVEEDQHVGHDQARSVTIGVLWAGLSSLRGNTGRYCAAGGRACTTVGVREVGPGDPLHVLGRHRLHRAHVARRRSPGPTPSASKKASYQARRALVRRSSANCPSRYALGARQLGRAHGLAADALELAQHRGPPPAAWLAGAVPSCVKSTPGPLARRIGAARRVGEALLVAHLGEEPPGHAAAQRGGQHLHRRVVGVRRWAGRGSRPAPAPAPTAARSRCGPRAPRPRAAWARPPRGPWGRRRRGGPPPPSRGARPTSPLTARIMRGAR